MKGKKMATKKKTVRKKGSTGAKAKTLEPKQPPAAPVPAAPPKINPDSLLVPCAFIPKEDITAYEVARLLHFIINKQLTFGDWKHLEQTYDGITRHLSPMQNVTNTPEETPEADAE